MNRREFIDLVGKGSISLALAPSFVAGAMEWGEPAANNEPEWLIQEFDFGRGFGMAGKWSDGKTYYMRFLQPRNEQLIETGKRALRVWHLEHV